MPVVQAPYFRRTRGDQKETALGEIAHSEQPGGVVNVAAPEFGRERLSRTDNKVVIAVPRAPDCAEPARADADAS